MTEPTQALERRDEAAIVKAIPVPRELQELGVRIGLEQETQTRVIFLPDELRARVNVVNPTTSFTQADPNWTPGIALVKVDKERDTYPLPGGKRGLSKGALETLSKAAGVLYTRTARVPREELQEGELWAYRATVGFRRSDGTVDEVTRERGFNADAERGDIEDAVRKATKRDSTDLLFPTAAAQEAEIRKRWNQELRFGPAKTESKAINRALRAGLAIPTAMVARDLEKPFLVIGFNFTPDYNDPEIKRALVAVGLNAQAAIYGPRERAEDLPELAAGDVPAEAVTPVADPAEVDGEAPPPADDREQAGAPEAEQAPAAGSSSSDPEPDLDEAAPKGGIRIPDSAIDAAGDTVVKGEGENAKTVRDVAAAGERGFQWLLWAARNLDPHSERWSAIATYLEHREPELWERLAAEAAEEGR